MKITEIIIESQELEEGWKQKLAGAALAGAAALGGGGASDANAQQATQNVSSATSSAQSDRQQLTNYVNQVRLYGEKLAIVMTLSKLAPHYFTQQTLNDIKKMNLDFFDIIDAVRESEKLSKNEKIYAIDGLSKGSDIANKLKAEGIKDLPQQLMEIVHKTMPSLLKLNAELTGKKTSTTQPTAQAQPKAQSQSNAQPNSSGSNGKQIETLSIAGIGEYVGEVDDKGQPSGKGTFTSKFGQKITGTWKNGEIRVKAKTESGEVSGTYDMYTGFTPDKKQTSATETQPKSQAQTTTQSSNSETQTGSFTTKNGLTYSGEIKNGKPHGYGKLTYPKGVVVSGISYPMGKVESGIWENGRLIKQQ